MMTRKLNFWQIKSNPGWAPILRHESRKEGIKHSWKFHNPGGVWNLVAWTKIQCSNHWAKELTPWRSCQRLNINLEAMNNLSRQIIEGRSGHWWHTPSSRESSFMMMRKPIFWRIKSNPGWAPILRHESRNEEIKHSWKFHNAGGVWTPVAWTKIQCSNHWAKESTHWCSCQRSNINLEAMHNLPR